MTLCLRTNSVFLPCEDESKECKLILPSGPPSYNPKVKIHDWQWHSLIEPRDNKTGHFRESTYKRFGTNEDPVGISVTRAMTEQVHTAGDYADEFQHRNLLNFYSFPLTETDKYESALKLTDIEYPKFTEPMDYKTTLKDDFPWHYKSKSSPNKQLQPIFDEPWLMNRRTLGYSSYDLERRPGLSKFLDDDLDIQNRAAAMKIQRFVSYNPCTTEYTEPMKLHEIALSR